ncbi:MAG: glycosyltransferase family A protein [Planctomycetota bacterium]
MGNDQRAAMTLRLLVPFHNVEPWISDCLESIRQQSMADWHCSLVDDLSDDGSLHIAQSFVETDRRFTLVRNSERRYQCDNYQRILRNPEFRDEDICISIDADDYLPDPGVFQRVVTAYENPTTWMTYGSFRRTQGKPGGCVCAPLTDTAHVRQLPWVTSHLRTWRLFLWKQIRPDDLLGPDGALLRSAGDLAFMFPMIEMAGNDHLKFLESVNYIYNDANPKCNHFVRAEEQKRNAQFLRSKPPYAPLADASKHLNGL